MFKPLTEVKISISSGVKSVDPSITQRIISALLIYSRARSTPRASTVSCVSRIPAVSIRRNEIPSMVIYSSMLSLVVPGISVTIARFSRKRAFIRLDLPALGRPTITVVIPSRIRRPVLAVDNNSSIAFKIGTSCSRTSWLVTSSISSSG